jgi:two-component system, OmpR family, phosphate regulon sensor histidine kinase PhoR
MWTVILIAAAVAAPLAVAWWFIVRLRDLRVRLQEVQAALAAARESHRKELSQAEAQQQTIFNSMIEGVLLLDAKGRIRLANQAIESLFGAASDLRGKTLLEAFQMHELRELAQRTLTAGQVRGFEIDLPGFDARCLQANASLLLDRDSRQQGMLIVFHDLTRLRQLENTRREFVANVSHELRTPLSLIKGYCETLLDGAKDDPAVAARFLGTIERHADRLTFLIEDLLVISRLESGHVALSIQRVALAPLVQRSLDELAARVKAPTAILDNLVPPDLCVLADADRLQQVLYNLVDNAIKYGPPDVRVSITAAPPEDGMVEVRVADNGPGIAPEHLERIFERFYRVDRARSRDAGGTGLGLSIVKHIVQSLKGEVWVTSEPGKGATFHLTLPVAGAPPEP